jgi:hypothetical protein
MSNSVADTWGGDGAKYWGGGGGGKFLTYMPKGFRYPFKPLSYANLSEHGSLDEMNKVPSCAI